MAIIQSLPFELLVRIFWQIDALSQVAECRLVCKAWRDPAERAMLERTINIRSDETIAKLLTVFARDSTKANLIKHLNFNYSAQDSNWLDVFLAFALTQKIQTLTGSLAADHVDRIVQRVGFSPAGMFCNMKTLKITGVSRNGESSIPSLQKLSLFFCKTLETMQLQFLKDDDWDFVDNLIKFTSLKHIYITGHIRDIKDIDKILDGCQQLHHVTVDRVFTDNFGVSTLEDAAMTERKHNLKTLTIGEAFEFMYDLLADYFVNKCPTMSKVTIDYVADFSLDTIISLPLLGTIIYSIPQKEFRIHIQGTEDDIAAVRYVRRYYDRVLIDHITADKHICLKIEDFD